MSQLAPCRRENATAARTAAVSQAPEPGWPPPFPTARIGPGVATIAPMGNIGLERIEALVLLGMTLAHLNEVARRGEVSPRLPLLMAIRDKLALALREES